MTRLWLSGLLRHRAGRLLGAAAGVAVAVSLLAALGGFLSASKATMTQRAVQSVAVDWQVQVAPGSDPQSVLDATRAAPGVQAALPVGYGAANGLSSTVNGSTQTTGAAVVLGLPPNYLQTFPATLSTFAGGAGGVLLAQQTASNLHAVPGTTVTVKLPGGGTATETVSGIVALNHPDALFQKVGAPKQAQPSAPPDNVLLLPAAEFSSVFTPLQASVPDAVHTQVHVIRDHVLPPDPAAAYVQDAGNAKNLEVRLAGAGVVGDNLGATLDAARQDSLYSQLLFLFLGVPGAVLAALLTATITASGAVRRRREQALLRTRGATTRQVLLLAGAEAGVVGVLGGVLGLLAGFGVQQVVLHSTASITWAAAAFAVGLLIAVLTVLVPAWRSLREASVTTGRVSIGGRRAPLWRRFGVDFLALAGAYAIFQVTGQPGYTLVLAPDGVAKLSVSYWAFAGPALLWVGIGLFTLRIVDLVLGRGRRLTGWLLRPLTGWLSTTVAAMLARQRGTIGRSVAVIALAGVFAVSTATFNSTYQHQAQVHARLTNGADVTVTEPAGATVGPAFTQRLATVPGVQHVEPLQHRFAYVGRDLQDLYGVNPATVTQATLLQDAYFQGGTAAQLMGRLAARPDGILVSAETVKDFQLHPGDLLKLRVQNAVTKQTVMVPFHYLGIVKSFPTAPKDSFLVANSSYLAQATGSNAVGKFLLDTGGRGTGAVSAAVDGLVGTSAQVSDVASARAAGGSSLTAVDLGGLTKLELAYAVLLAAAGAVLVLALGFSERRRTFAVVTALGGTKRHTASVVLAEATIVTVGGVAVGALGGWVLSEFLVSVLTGVFNPPPSILAVPWVYLGVVLAATVAGVGGVVALAARASARAPISALRGA